MKPHFSLHNSLRRFACPGTSCVVLALFIAPARAEVIRAFHADVRLQSDTSLEVTESIVMDFEGAQKHGIYRIIPIRYTRHKNSYSLPLAVQSVTDENGSAYHYSTSRNWGDINIKIGDPDRTISGVHTYRIRYTVRRAVNFFGGAPEVYWNATGNEWPFAMQQATRDFIRRRALRSMASRRLRMSARSARGSRRRCSGKTIMSCFLPPTCRPPTA